MSKSFYEELVKSTFVKTASSTTEKEVKAAVAGLDNDQMEALAEEIANMTKSAEETPREKDTEVARTESESSAEKKLKDSSEEKTTDGTADQTAVEQAGKAKAEATAGKERMDEDDDKKKEAVDSPVPADAKKDDSEYANKSASEVLEGILTEGAEAEIEMQKQAYLYAEQIMKSAGFDLVDYIYGKTENEKVANLVAVEAEKLAFVSGASSFAVADDILQKMSDMVAE